MKAYRSILVKLRREYGSLKAGARIAGGNGAAVASNFRVTHNDVLWKVKLSTIQLSTCDCFHPNKLGQNMLARVMYGGLDCSKGEPACCMDEGMRGEDGKVVTRLQAAQCVVLDTRRKIAPAI